MSTSANITQGVVLKRGDGGGSEVFTSIGNIESLKGPGMSATMVEVTDLDSTWVEEKAVIKDGGEVSFDLFFLPSAAAQQAGIWTDFTGLTKRNWQIVDTGTTPNQTTWAFAAYVTKIDPSYAKKDVIKGSITLRVTGAVTKTAA